MAIAAAVTNQRDFSIEFHLLGQVDYEQCLALQERLVFEADSGGGRPIDVLLCEHFPTITVGRAGSRRHIRVPEPELASRRLEVRWISRGGGCLVHLPGQLAIYPIVHLKTCGWSVGQYMRRLNQALRAIVTKLGAVAETPPGRFGVWGRTGQLAACGVAVKYGIAFHGAFLNVNPAMDVVRMVDVVEPEWGQSGRETTMSCLLAERNRAVRMATVRALAVEQLVEALCGNRYHLNVGHPFLGTPGASLHETGLS